MEKMVRLRNIEIRDPEEDLNWNSKVIHFHLKHPHYFYYLVLDILNSADDLGIKIKLSDNENYLLRRYGGLITDGDRRKEKD